MIHDIEEQADLPKNLRVVFSDGSAVDVRRNQFTGYASEAERRSLMTLAAIQRHAAESNEAHRLNSIQDAIGSVASQVLFFVQRLERLESPLCHYFVAAAERPVAERPVCGKPSRLHLDEDSRPTADRLTRSVSRALEDITHKLRQFADAADDIAAEIQGCELFKRVWLDASGYVEGGGGYQPTDVGEATTFYAPGEKRPPLAPLPAKKARPRRKANGKPAPKPKAAPRPAGKRSRRAKAVAKRK